MPTAESVLREIEGETKHEYLPILGPEKGAFIESLVRERGADAAVEIGNLVGYSLIRIARNLGEGGVVIGLELSNDLAVRARQNVARAGLEKKVVVIQGDAREVIPTLAGPFDFVLLDAEKTQNLNYLKKLESKLSPGAVIVANAAGIHATRMASYLDYVRNSPDYSSRIEVFGDDAMEISVYKP